MTAEPTSDERLDEPKQERLAANFAAVRARLVRACERAGRDPAGVRLVAVTKSARPAWIRAALEGGQRDLAENRPQQLVERAELFARGRFDPAPVWHLIGTLQRNKVRKVVPLVRWIHSVDSVRLLETLDRILFTEGLFDAARPETAPALLFEVNVSGEASKEGFRPDEVAAAWSPASPTGRLPFRGLMTMAPFADDPEAARPVFRGLRELRDRLQQTWGVALPELSMGMSGDFEVAVEEGATQVRVGSALWEGLGE